MTTTYLVAVETSGLGFGVRLQDSHGLLGAMSDSAIACPGALVSSRGVLDTGPKLGEVETGTGAAGHKLWIRTTVPERSWDQFLRESKIHFSDLGRCFRKRGYPWFLDSRLLSWDRK